MSVFVHSFRGVMELAMKLLCAPTLCETLCDHADVQNASTSLDLCHALCNYCALYVLEVTCGS